jgi:predicted nucleic acid-binding protein
MSSSKIVLDCSVTISWFMDNESSDSSLKLLNRIAEVGAVVPSIWKLEVGNVLLIAQRKNCITKEQMLNALYTLNELPISIDQSTVGHAWLETIELAQNYNLTLYDASYLELSMRLTLPIATFDRELQNAANIAGVRLVYE